MFKKRKDKLREKLLLKEYNEGKILQINNNIDNKEYFKRIGENKDEFKEDKQ